MIKSEALHGASLAHDGWSTNARSFIGVTAFYISSEWELKKVRLGVKEVTEITKDANAIMANIYSICRQFDLVEAVPYCAGPAELMAAKVATMKKAFLSVTTDNGGADPTAGSAIGEKGVRGFVHTLQLVLSDFEKVNTLCIPSSKTIIIYGTCTNVIGPPRSRPDPENP